MSKVLAVVASSLQEHPALLELKRHLMKTVPSVSMVISDKTLPCSILLDRVPDVMTPTIRKRYGEKIEQVEEEQKKDEEEEDQEEEEESATCFLLFYMTLEDYQNHISPMSSQHPFSLVEAARKLYPSHRKIMIMEQVRDSFEVRAEQCYYEDVFLPKMAVLFECDVIETFNAGESVYHLAQIIGCVASPFRFRQVSRFGRKVARPRHGASGEEKAWVASLMTIPGISEQRALAISSRFASPAALMDFLRVGSERTLSDKERDEILAALAAVETASAERVGKIGKSMAKKLALIFTTEHGSLNLT